MESNVRGLDGIGEINLESLLNRGTVHRVYTIADIYGLIARDRLTVPSFLSWRDLSEDVIINYLNLRFISKYASPPLYINVITCDVFDKQVSIINRDILEDNYIQYNHYSVIKNYEYLDILYKVSINHPDIQTYVFDFNELKIINIEGVPTRYQIPIGMLLNIDAKYMSELTKTYNTLERQILLPRICDLRVLMLSRSIIIFKSFNLNKSEQLEWISLIDKY